MHKKIVARVLIIFVVAVLFAGLCVLTFVDFHSFRKVYYNINYETTVGGSLIGKGTQTVQKGKDGEMVTAVPDEGYRFLRWVDTCSPNPERTDKNIKKDINARAKFVKISDIKYRILLVHATEVQATFTDKDGNDVVVDYKMNEKDLAVCKMSTELFDVCLNELFDGLVTFEIDEYYTKEVMREDNFKSEINIFDGNLYSYLFAQRIPEITHRLNNYRSIIVNVPLYDSGHSLHSGCGDTNSISASIGFRVPRNTMPNGDSIKNYDLISDYADYAWVDIINDYTHAFVHTLQSQISDEYPYHNIWREYRKAYTGKDINIYSFTIDKLFLLNQAEFDGKTVGIPFPVWGNEIYNVYYKCNSVSMGHINKASPLKVAKGCDGLEVEAIPSVGYRFVGWSDGLATTKRIDRNIQSDMEFTAYFQPKEYTIAYLATEGGYIQGKTTQIGCIYGSFETVVAVAEEGYRFVGWHETGMSELVSSSAIRTDCVSVGNIEIYDNNNNGIEVTAVFEKIS